MRSARFALIEVSRLGMNISDRKAVLEVKIAFTSITGYGEPIVPSCSIGYPRRMLAKFNLRRHRGGEC